MIDSIRIAQVIDVTSASFLAGKVSHLVKMHASSNLEDSNALYSNPLLHRIINKSEEKRLISQWRHMFVIGFRATQFQYLLCLTSFSYLVYSSRNSPLLFRLYTATALILPLIIPYTVTVQRTLIAALIFTSGEVGRPWDWEEGKSTDELVRLWDSIMLWVFPLQFLEL
jgi:hypothetical protein